MSAKGRPVFFGPQNCHATLLRDRKRKELARRAEEKNTKERALRAAKELLANKRPHRKLTEAEKKAHKEALRLVREKGGKQVGLRTGDADTAAGCGVVATTTKGRGPLFNGRGLQQTLEDAEDVVLLDSSSS